MVDYVLLELLDLSDEENIFVILVTTIRNNLN